MIYAGRCASHCEVLAIQSLVLCVLSFAITMMVVLVKMTLMIVAKIYSDDGNGDKDSADDSNDNVNSLIVAQTYPNPLFISNKV